MFDWGFNKYFILVWLSSIVYKSFFKGEGAWVNRILFYIFYSRTRSEVREICIIFLKDSGPSLFCHLLAFQDPVDRRLVPLVLLLMLPLLFTRFLYSKKQFWSAREWSLVRLLVFDSLLCCLLADVPMSWCPAAPSSSSLCPKQAALCRVRVLLLSSFPHCGVDSPLAWHFNFERTEYIVHSQTPSPG